MIQLKKDIENSGLLKSFIASKVGLSPAHFSMMLNNKATMPDDIRVKVVNLLKQASSLTA